MTLRSAISLMSSDVSVRSLPLPDKPSIAVLPFQNMSGDPEQEYFADGMVEDIITALSRFKSRGSSSSLGIQSSPTRAKPSISSRSAVNLVCVMCLKAVFEKPAIAFGSLGSLIEAATGAHLWAERYDRALEDIFAVQDEITHSIIGAIAPGILAAEIQRSQGKEAAELGHWERVMRAHWHIRRFTREDSNEAIRLLDELLRRQPDNALALADLAFSLHFASLFGWTDFPAEARVRMSQTARRAVAADEQDAAAHTSLAIHQSVLGSARKRDPPVAARDRSRPQLNLRARVLGHRIRIRRRMRSSD